MSTGNNEQFRTCESPTERKIFSDARRLNGKSRHDYLESACGHDSKLRKRVDRLLDTFEERDSDLIERAFKSVLQDLNGSNKSRRKELQFSIDEILNLFETGTGDSLGRINHYEIKELIGRGAFGVVFRAFDTRLTRMVAIKILAPTLSSSPGFRERFLHEARAAAAIRHDNVVRIHAVEDSPFPFIVMEMVHGGTLRSHILDQGQLAMEETLELGTQIIRGLAAAHQKGIVHLDVKPANILLEELPDGKKCAKLTDFGLALMVDGQGEVLPDTVLGTPAYMAPEHAKGESVDQRADLFSFGSILYAMGAGQAAFIGGETLSVLRGVVESKRAELPVGVHISKSLLGVIDRLHSTLPENRYDSADAVLRDLVRLSRRRSRRLAATSHKSVIASFGIVLALAALTIAGAKLIPGNYAGAEVSASEGDGNSVTAEKPTWSRARQKLFDVTNQIEKLDEQFESEKCFYEIRDGRVTYVKMPFAKDLSPASSLKEIEHLFLEPPGSPEREIPVGLEFISGMKQLRTLELKSFPTRDLEPLRGLQIEKLDLWYSRMNAQVYPAPVDLEPLKGMPLHWLNAGGCGIASLQPLKGMQLEALCLNFSKPFSDLSPLKGMPIHTLQVSSTEVGDLSPLVGIPLKILEVSNSKVTDLSPLVDMDLDELYIKGLKIDDLQVLKRCNIRALWMDVDASQENLVRSIPGLERLNGVSLEEFFKDQAGSSPQRIAVKP